MSGTSCSVYIFWVSLSNPRIASSCVSFILYTMLLKNVKSESSTQTFGSRKSEESGHWTIWLPTGTTKCSETLKTRLSWRYRDNLIKHPPRLSCLPVEVSVYNQVCSIKRYSRVHSLLSLIPWDPMRLLVPRPRRLRWTGGSGDDSAILVYIASCPSCRGTLCDFSCQGLAGLDGRVALGTTVLFHVHFSQGCRPVWRVSFIMVDKTPIRMSVTRVTMNVTEYSGA